MNYKLTMRISVELFYNDSKMKKSMRLWTSQDSVAEKKTRFWWINLKNTHILKELSYKSAHLVNFKMIIIVHCN